MRIITILLVAISIPVFGQGNFNKIKKEFNTKNEAFKKQRKSSDAKIPGHNQYKRWEWYWESRVNKDGSFPDKSVIADAWKKEIKKNQTRANATTWESLGPNLQANEDLYGVGRVNCVEFHPTNAQIMWAGTPAGGIWKTTNGGSSWFALADDLPVLGVSSIAVDPNNADVLYIATGDRDRSSSLSAFGARFSGDTKSIGLLKSIDGGGNWTTVLSSNQEDSTSLSEVLIDPNNSNRVIVATSRGIFVSTDAGSSWALTQLGDFMDIEFKPGSSIVIYATTFAPYSPIIGHAQFFVSTDYGSTWVSPTTFSGYKRIQIATTPANPNGVDLLCVGDDSQLSTLKYSDNFGVSWNDYYPRTGNKNL